MNPNQAAIANFLNSIATSFSQPGGVRRDISGNVIDQTPQAQGPQGLDYLEAFGPNRPSVQARQFNLDGPNGQPMVAPQQAPSAPQAQQTPVEASHPAFDFFGGGQLTAPAQTPTQAQTPQTINQSAPQPGPPPQPGVPLSPPAVQPMFTQQADNSQFGDFLNQVQSNQAQPLGPAPIVSGNATPLTPLGPIDSLISGLLDLLGGEPKTVNLQQ